MNQDNQISKINENEILASQIRESDFEHLAAFGGVDNTELYDEILNDMATEQQNQSE